MKNHWLQIRLVILAALLLTFPVQAQQQVTDEENIKVLRTNIQRMVQPLPMRIIEKQCFHCGANSSDCC
jgi:hypothetical protein